MNAVLIDMCVLRVSHSIDSLFAFTFFWWYFSFILRIVSTVARRVHVCVEMFPICVENVSKTWVIFIAADACSKRFSLHSLKFGFFSTWTKLKRPHVYLRVSWVSVYPKQKDQHGVIHPAMEFQCIYRCDCILCGLTFAFILIASRLISADRMHSTTKCSYVCECVNISIKCSLFR